MATDTTEGRFITGHSLNRPHDWSSMRRGMILRDETHVLMSIEDIDRLLEGWSEKDNAALHQAQAELRSADGTIERLVRREAELEAQVRTLTLLLSPRT